MLWGLWADLVWAVDWTGLQNMLWGLWPVSRGQSTGQDCRTCSAVCGPVSCGQSTGRPVSHGQSTGRPVSHGQSTGLDLQTMFRGLWTCLTWAVDWARLQNMLWGLWACLTRAVDCVQQTKANQVWHAVGSGKISNTEYRHTVSPAGYNFVN